MSMREQLNLQLLQGTVSGATFVPGNSAKDLNPLGYFFRKLNRTNPTAGGNVGNIDASTEEWWRHNTAVLDSGGAEVGGAFTLDVSTYAGFKVALRRMYNFCGRGSGGYPNLCVGTQTAYETYMNALDQQVRYSNTQLADMGFENIKLAGATFIWDEVVPDVENGTAATSELGGGSDASEGTVFFLNTNFYKLVIDSETDIVVTPFIEPENQTARTAKILFMGNAAVSNMRKQGVAYGISETIVA